MNTVTYRLKGIHPKTWRIKTKNAFGKKKKDGYEADKQIAYFVGKESCFVEDNPDAKSSRVPEFEYNEVTGFTELKVNDSNRSLINYLETHPWYDKKYFRFDANEEAKRQLERFDDVEKALGFLKGKSGDEVVAIGLLVIGSHAVNMGEAKVLKELKTLAFNKPNSILNVTSNVDFTTLLIGATAFVKGVVSTNDTKTAVIWKGSESGIITKVAKGENPIEKLSEFLVIETEESRTTLQEMGNRIGSNFSEADLPIEDDKDAKIAELEAKLKSLQENVNSEDGAGSANEETDDLDSLRAKYAELFGQEVPNNMKNNKEWILSKLS